MSQTLPRIDGPGDAELISAVRGGDLDAYGDLFERHVGAARALARQLVSHGDADDLVSDAFAKVLGVLQRGGGPDLAFRAYLLTAIRRLHIDKIRATSRVHTTDDMEKFDPGMPFQDTAVEGFENAAAAAAFASLPERWQLVLWHTEVEGQKPAEVGELLGMSANSVSALAYRAREGLRQAYLNSHATEFEEDATCRWTHNHLGAYVRNGVSRRDAVKIEDHLDECRKCMAIYLELTEVNSNLGAILAPLLLGGAAAGYVASVGAPGGLLGLLSNLKAQVNPVVAGVAAATVAAGGIAAGAVALNANNNDQVPVGSPPAAGQGPNSDNNGGGDAGSAGSGNNTSNDAPPAQAPDPTDTPAKPDNTDKTDTPKRKPTPAPEPAVATSAVVQAAAPQPAQKPNKPKSYPAGGGASSPNPDAVTKPTKPKPAPKPPPPPPPPPPPSNDLKFGTPSFGRANGSGDAYQVHVPIDGLAPKATATLIIDGSSRLRIRSASANCTSTGGQAKCTISSTPSSVDFTVEQFKGGSMTIDFTLIPNGENQDSDPNNNRAFLRLPSSN